MTHFLKKLLVTVITLMSIVSLVTAQDECPDIVDDALFSLSDLCFNIGRNQACYGNGDIIAVPVDDSAIDFTIPGDTAAIAEIDSLSLSPYSGSLDDWGIAILVVQADIPDTLPGQNVTMLMFGDTNLTTDNGAYYFSAGIGTPDCAQAPNGLLIQTPEGAGQVNLTMNGIEISIGSTAFFGFSDEDEFLIALLEGTMELAIEDTSIALDPEFFTTILIDEDGNATGEFSEPEPVENLELPILPTGLLPESIEDSEDGDMVEISGDMIIPQSGPWSSNLGDATFGGDCPDFFVDAFDMQTLQGFGFTNGMIQDIIFDDEDVLGPLFLDLAEPAFDSAGASLTVVEDTPTNVYQVVISVEGGFVITYTWNVVSDGRVEGNILQEISIPPIVCTIDIDATLEYQG